jgi:hypothetical protein
MLQTRQPSAGLPGQEVHPQLFACLHRAPPQEQRAKRQAIQGTTPWKEQQQEAFEVLEKSALQGLLFASVKP